MLGRNDALAEPHRTALAERRFGAPGGLAGCVREVRSGKDSAERAGGHGANEMSVAFRLSPFSAPR